MADASRSVNDTHANKHWQLIPDDNHFPVLDLPAGRSLLLGRDPSADLVLSHPKVSRQHAALVVKDNCIEVRDLGSRNGVSINGKLVSEGSVYPGDELCFERIGFHVSSPFGKTEVMAAVPLQKTQVMASSFALLEDVTGQYAGKTFALAGTELTVGRSESCNIVLSHPSVSFQHAGFYQLDRQWYLTDNGSTNGTLVNGEPADQTRLQDGDKISFAGILLQYKTLDSLTKEGTELDSGLLEAFDPADRYEYQYGVHQRRRSQSRPAAQRQESESRFEGVSQIAATQHHDFDESSGSGAVFGVDFGPEVKSDFGEISESAESGESAIARQLEQERKNGPLHRPPPAEVTEQEVDYAPYINLAVGAAGALLVLTLLFFFF